MTAKVHKKLRYTKSEIAVSRKEVLAQVIKFLSVEDIENQFAKRDNGFYSNEKFLVVWKGNKNNLPCENRLDLCDNVYATISGLKCCYVSVGLFHEKQIKGFPAIERGLIEIGLLLSDKKDKAAFFDKYAKPYNQKMLARKNDTNANRQHD